MKLPGSVNITASPYLFGVGILLPIALLSAAVGTSDTFEVHVLCSRVVEKVATIYSAFHIVLRSLRIDFLIIRIEGKSRLVSTSWIFCG